MKTFASAICGLFLLLFIHELAFGHCYPRVYYRYRYRYRTRYRYVPTLVSVPVQVPVYSFGYQQAAYPPPPVQVQESTTYALPGQPRAAMSFQGDCQARIVQMEQYIRKIQQDAEVNVKLLEDCRRALTETRRALEESAKKPPAKKGKKKKQKSQKTAARNYFALLARARCAACHSGKPDMKANGNLVLFPDGPAGSMRQLTRKEITKIRGQLADQEMPPLDNDKKIPGLTEEEFKKAMVSLDLIKEQLLTKG